MTSSNKFANALQALLVAVSIAFTLTACAYGAMTIHRIDPTRSVELTSDGPVSHASDDEVARNSGPQGSVRNPPRPNAKTTAKHSAHGQWLLDQLDRYGAAVLLIELAVLATTALAVMATDRGNST